MKTLTAISIEKNLLQEVDAQRGLIPRSTYVCDIISNFIKKQRKVGFDGSALSLKTPTRIEGNDRR